MCSSGFCERETVSLQNCKGRQTKPDGPVPIITRNRRHRFMGRDPRPRKFTAKKKEDAKRKRTGVACTKRSSHGYSKCIFAGMTTPALEKRKPEIVERQLEKTRWCLGQRKKQQIHTGESNEDLDGRLHGGGKMT